MSGSISKPRRSRLVVLGGLGAALVLASGGTAVGATMVTSKMIKNDTIKTIDLNFPVGQDASSLASPVKPDSAKAQQVLATTLTIDDAGGSGIAQGFVELRNSSGNPATVDVTLAHEQDPTHAVTVTATLAKGSEHLGAGGPAVQRDAGRRPDRAAVGHRRARDRGPVRVPLGDRGPADLTLGLQLSPR